MTNSETVEENLAEMRARHNARYSQPDVEVIEAGRVRDFLLAMDEPADHAKPGAVVPALFLLTLARNRRPQAPRGSAVNAGDEFELFAPVHVGDTITSTRELLGIDLKDGKRGLMYLARSRPEWRQLSAGFELPPLSKGPVSRQRLVEWCAAENDYYELHYDDRVAQRMGLPGTPIQGTFRYALMAQMIERWLAGSGTLRRISANYRGLDLEGDTITARGLVRSVTPASEKSGTTVMLDVWIENQRGERSTQGEATVELIETVT
jgi:acyl dehydratase